MIERSVSNSGAPLATSRAQCEEHKAGQAWSQHQEHKAGRRLSAKYNRFSVAPPGLVFFTAPPP